MLLGSIIAGLNDEAAASEALLARGDIVLMADTEAARQLHGKTAGEYVSGAVRRFSNLASDEDWLQLMSALERSDSPAGACLSTMLRWSIKRDRQEKDNDGAGHSCTCGSGDGSCHEDV